MARLQCQSCGGIYDDVLPDGMLYFHRCPPLSVVELATAVAAGAVTLPKGETPDVAVLTRTYERANLRDENITGEPAAAGKPAPIRSAGRGVLELVPIDARESRVVVVNTGNAPPPAPGV